jgi:very-short-patch-repair endonuclease
VQIDDQQTTSIGSAGAPKAPDTPLSRLLRDARLRLVETGTRNRLVHTPRGAKRSRSIAVTVDDRDVFFETAVLGRRSMRFVPRVGGPPAIPAEVVSLDEATGFRRTGVGWLQTILDAETLQKKLASLHRDARTAEEEQGINILFLAVGFLRWFEDGKSEVMREAPLLLLPVALVRDKVRSTFDLRGRDEEVLTNQALQERLRSDFGIALPDVPEGDGWHPAEYFAAVRTAIASKTAWSVDGEGLELGFYSFSKLLMIKDLDPTAWPEGELLENELLQGLLVDGFREEEPLYGDEVRLDEVFQPADLIQVVDADSSQTLVIETVRAGRNLVVQGPPGTGKSQTIANVIAAAVHDGKTVLFVAEKMVALEVVQERLEKAGIGQVCLQLHSRAANKRLLAEELDRTLRLQAPRSDTAVETARFTAARDRLNATAAAIHAPVGDTGCSPFGALAGLADQSRRPPVPQELVDEAAAWNGARHVEVCDLSERLAVATIASGPVVEHAWHGVAATYLQPAELDRLLPRLEAAALAAQRLHADFESLTTRLGIAAVGDLAGTGRIRDLLKAVAALPLGADAMVAALATSRPRAIDQVVATGKAFAAIRASSAETFNDEVWHLHARPVRDGIRNGRHSFFARWGSRYRQACRELATALRSSLPRGTDARLALADAALALHERRDALLFEAKGMEAALGHAWRGEQTDFGALGHAQDLLDSIAAMEDGPDVDRILSLSAERGFELRVTALGTIIADAARVMTETSKILEVDLAQAFGADALDRVALSDFVARCRGWIAGRGGFDEWARLSDAHDRLRAVAPKLAGAIAEGALPAREVEATLRLAWSEAVWKRAVAVSPELRRFVGDDHDRVVGEFRGLDKARRASDAALIRHRHVSAMPRGSFGPMAVIRGEIARKRGHMAVRRLVKEAGPALQKIKPVFLMSPISVAQYLPPASVAFDLLVVDEASQIRPEDALGLVARAKQIVVVGDKKQLPPTSFFDRVTADEEETDDDLEAVDVPHGAKATAMESILSLCEARGLGGRMLRWHYRSRHPSLIAVSNAEFYKHLVMPPAPDTERRRQGLVMRRIAGAYDRGGKRNNVIEAEAIVDTVAAHAREGSELSLGIVTFSTVQRDAITDALETRRRTDPALDALLNREGGDEEVFIKSLENVQGDERDIILVSVGYGPRTAGAKLDSMAFGPVSGEGGERRLNVLFTRARERCEIFCSFGAGDIVLERTKGEGPRVLKRFLQYAETGVLEEHRSVGEDFDSPFEQHVAEAIEGMGYKVEKQIGSAGFKIDLAVRHPDEPGRFMLAIECDGATYHSALWARERDRMRQEVLENLGWRFHRIWSTDWFYRRGAQLERLRIVLEAAATAAEVVAVVVPPEAVVEPSVSEPVDVVVEEPYQAPAYEMAVVTVPLHLEPHDVPVPKAAAIVLEIVRTEGPISREEIARRYGSLFGKERTGTRIVQATDKALRRLMDDGSPILVEGRFWMTPEQRDLTPVRSRTNAPGALQKAEAISPREIAAAIAIAERENGKLSTQDLPIAVSRVFGFQRAGPDFKAAVSAVAPDP